MSEPSPKSRSATARTDAKRKPAPAVRSATLERNTRETQILCSINLDGSGQTRIDTQIGFFTHMLETLGKHSCVDIDLTVRGDLHVDQHHTVEDTGIVLGEAVKKALGDKAGIARAGCFTFPLDESLASAVIDLSGRSYFHWNGVFAEARIGELDTAVIAEFFGGFANAALCNLHVDLVRGKNDHHKCEAIFKAFARALKQAVAVDPQRGGTIPSTKGVI